ncbi:DUF6319 family protein [Saccharopolyspora sp. CA-218241]|uniref:DUF6319 family protein n=1 Tax=Saccharopolyspora sp. CA-218241 TaxID=3240027 RepID=UPI003D995F71
MSKARALSSEELGDLREQLASGATPVVWFTASAVGVPEGRSGKVIALGEPAEGDFIQVRPAGSKDVLSFSAAEVTLVKPARKPAKPRSQAPAATPVDEPRYEPVPPPEPVQAAPPAAEQPRPAARRSKPRPPAGASVVLTADQEGQWSVEVTTGKKRVVRPTSVPASAVAQAAKALHDDVSAAVEPMIEAAREQQRARVEQLREELDAAQQALAELTE